MANRSSCAVFITACDHSNLSSERWDKLDGERVLGNGWETYGEGARMTVPGEDVRDVLSMERKAAEVDRRRFGGEKEDALDF